MNNTRRIYTIYWEVDGASGNTQVLANCRNEVESYFSFNFARFGYTLRSIE